MEDTTMFRTWSNEEEGNFLKPSKANSNIHRTRRYPRFLYMVRLHFCEFQTGINSIKDRVFLIYIRGTIIEQSADMFRWAGGREIPYRRDYVVLISQNDKKKVNLSVTLQANPDDSKTRYTNVILNGIEIFKLNDTDGNLGGKKSRSTSHYQNPIFSTTKKSFRKKEGMSKVPYCRRKKWTSKVPYCQRALPVDIDGVESKAFPTPFHLCVGKPPPSHYYRLPSR
uniref:Malectin-like domain-containing protein n=1 Tax=Cucumis sativus TaxID=3659 RepID=A0A0A0LV96_CUCSA